MMWLSVLVVVSIALGWWQLARRGLFRWQAPPARAREERAAGTLTTVVFPAKDGTKLEGWLVLPQGPRAPLVIMAPGLTGTKEGYLEQYAWRFAREGIATLMIDFRCFGGSGGLPRHWVDPVRHQEDYLASLQYARTVLAEDGSIDGDRIALWGTSFSGGTALGAAASDGKVRAVVAQCPYLETTPELQPKGLSLARFVLLATLDLIPFLPPVYVPVFGRPGEWVFAPSRENPSVRGFDRMTGSRFWRMLPREHRGGWDNRMLARMLATFDQFSPMQAVEALSVPVLFVAAEHDDLIPSSLVRRAHDLLAAGGKQLLTFACGHFDLYLGEVGDANREAQAEFLARVLARTDLLQPHRACDDPSRLRDG